MLLADIPRFGRYDPWADGRLYGACATLLDAVHRALNHLLVGDRTWLGRIRGEPSNDLPLDLIYFVREAEPMA